MFLPRAAMRSLGLLGLECREGMRHHQELKALRHQECDEEAESRPHSCFSWKAVPPDAALYKAKRTLPSGMQDGGMPSEPGWRPGSLLFAFQVCSSRSFFGMGFRPLWRGCPRPRCAGTQGGCGILEWFGMEGTLRILQFHPAATGGDTSH